MLLNTDLICLPLFKELVATLFRLVFPVCIHTQLTDVHRVLEHKIKAECCGSTFFFLGLIIDTQSFVTLLAHYGWIFACI